MKRILSLLFAAILMFAFVTGCSAEEADAPEETSATTEEAAESEPVEDEAEESSEAAGEDSSEFSGSWENPDGSVFREITFKDDGTAQAVNYAGGQEAATWSYEDDYLKVEGDAGSTWGSSVEWISGTEFKWSYESDTWTKVE